MATDVNTVSICRYCSQNVSYTGGSTGNLFRHIKKKHVTVPLKTLRQSPYDSKLQPSSSSVANNLLTDVTSKMPALACVSQKLPSISEQHNQNVAFNPVPSGNSTSFSAPTNSSTTILFLIQLKFDDDITSCRVLYMYF